MTPEEMNAIELAITSDGTPAHTVITDQQGRKLVNVMAVSWTLPDCNSLAHCTLVLEGIFLKLDVRTVDGYVSLKPHGWWRRFKEWRRRRHVRRAWQRTKARRF